MPELEQTDPPQELTNRYLYHPDFPEGRKFCIDNRTAAGMREDGWCDSPADLPPEQAMEITEDGTAVGRDEFEAIKHSLGATGELVGQLVEDFAELEERMHLITEPQGSLATLKDEVQDLRAKLKAYTEPSSAPQVAVDPSGTPMEVLKGSPGSVTVDQGEPTKKKAAKK